MNSKKINLKIAFTLFLAIFLVALAVNTCIAEEHAEEVIGRWSKPYVATLPNTAIDDLNDLVADGNIILDRNFSNIKSIAG